MGECCGSDVFLFLLERETFPSLRPPPRNLKLFAGQLSGPATEVKFLSSQVEGQLHLPNNLPRGQFCCRKYIPCTYPRVS